MQKSVLLGVSVGESFAEFSLLSDSKPLAQKRVYLSRENLKQSLQQFVGEHSATTPAHAFVSLRLPKKLLNYELSGAVAHITTEGFEHWLDVCGTNNALTNKDLLFSLHERVLADGRVETPLKAEDLEAIAAKLKLVDCKKVCLHLLHASTNPVHENQAREVLQSHGLEVFVPAKTDNPDEVSRWRRNALNATISSVFAERKAEITGALDGVLGESQIHFLDGAGGKAISANSALDGLFAAASALGYDKGAGHDVLYLGFEHFLFISGKEWDSAWQSPWGAVENKHRRCKELGIQPTLGIALNNFGRFDFTSQQESWEPGPMFLGRGQKPTLLDLWAENAKLGKLGGLEDRLSAPGIQRFKNALFALSKISQTRDTDVGHLTKEMQSLTLQRIAMESYLERRSSKLVVTGPLAAVFANAFKKDANTTVDNDEYSESAATARWGFQVLQGSL